MKMSCHNHKPLSLKMEENTHESVDLDTIQGLLVAYTGPEYFPDDYIFGSASVSASKQRRCTVCPTKSSSTVREEASPVLFCHSKLSVPTVNNKFIGSDHLQERKLLCMARNKSGTKQWFLL